MVARSDSAERRASRTIASGTGLGAAMSPPTQSESIGSASSAATCLRSLAAVKPNLSFAMHVPPTEVGPAGGGAAGRGGLARPRRRQPAQHLSDVGQTVGLVED